MPDPIQALALTDAERLQILEYWGSQEAFLSWQAQTLAAEIEARASRKAAAETQTVVIEQVEAVKADFPTLWPVEQADAEAP